MEWITGKVKTTSVRISSKDMRTMFKYATRTRIGRRQVNVITPYTQEESYETPRGTFKFEFHLGSDLPVRLVRKQTGAQSAREYILA